MRLAVIADIHGNLPALEAVLDDIRRRDIDQMINLGDCVSGPLWPREVCDLLMSYGGHVVRGNHDRWVSRANPSGASDRFAVSKLTADHLKWLRLLPSSIGMGDGIFACHGTPTDDNRYLIEDVSDCRLVRARPATIRERLGDLDARIVLCGHSHQPHLIQLIDGPLILNPGSVGCPSYDDPGDEPHVSEARSPHARYAILNVGADRVSADLIAVAYDWQAASARAEHNDRPEWAHGLRTGWFRSTNR